MENIMRFVTPSFIMRFVTPSLLVTTALLGVCAGEASAQTLVVARVPFAFTLRGQRFPAGTYEIREAGNSGGVLSVQGEYNNNMSFTFAQPVFGRDPAGDRPALVFSHHDNGYQLSEIWQSATEGVTVPAEEHEADRSRGEIGQNGSQDLTYIVVASLQ
jgi:hypothetical protein